MNEKKSIAFFDVDGTILHGSTGIMVSTYLFKIGLLDLSHVLRAGYYASLHYLNLVNHRKMFGEGVRPFIGFNETELRQICDNCFEQVAHGNLYRSGIKLIDIHKKRNDIVVLISSGPKYIIEAIGKFVGAENTITSAAIVKDDIFTEILEEPICYGAGKKSLADKYAARLGLSLKDCYFYSDSASDLHLLKAVGFPKAVNPDLELEINARLRGWEIFKFKDTFNSTRNPLLS